MDARGLALICAVTGPGLIALGLQPPRRFAPAVVSGTPTLCPGSAPAAMSDRSRRPRRHVQGNALETRFLTE